MSAPVHTIEDFVNVVRRSGLVEDAPLDEAVARWPDRGQPLPDELPAALVAAGLLTQWQADQLRKGRHRGFVLGKYKLLRLLGSGGMSRVYLADHLTLRGKVAIKVLPAANVEKTSYLARFEREARAVFGLNHPNIVRTLDLDTSGPVPFFALEYVDGIDLHNKVKQEGSQSLRDAADYVRQAALGLQYAHQENVVHRDIKPANLMLDRHGTIKILDFGLALAGDQEGDSLTREHDEKVLGTADYLAPEQALDSHKADSRSDIYALGCTLFYLLAGRPPFPKGTLAERIQAHQKQPAPRLRDERPDVPHAIDEICSRMLEKHPDARPQSAREVAEALDAWLRTAAAGQGAGRPEPSRTASLRRGAAAEGSGTAVSSSDIDSGAPPGQPGSGSGIDSGVIQVAGAGGRATVKLPSLPRRAGGPPASRPAATGGESLVFDVGAAPAPPTRKPAAPKLVTGGPKAETGPEAARARKKPLEFAGLPVGFWVVAATGLLLAGVLGFMVLRPKPKKPKVVKESAVEESGAAVHGEADDEAPDAPDADAKSGANGDEAAAEPAAGPNPKPGRTPPPETKGNKPAKPAEPAPPGPLDHVNLAPKDESPAVTPGDEKAVAPAEKATPAAGAKPAD